MTVQTQETQQVPASDPQPQNANAPNTDIETTGPQFGLLDDGSFVASFAGQRLSLTADQLSAPEISLSGVTLPIPGLSLKSLSFNSRQRKLSLLTGVAIPTLADGEVTISVDKDGKVSGSGALNSAFDVPGIASGAVTLAVSEQGALTGNGSLNAADLVPSGVNGVTAEGSADVSLSQGRLTGSGTLSLAYADLGDGTVSVTFGENGLSATGQIRISPPFLNEVTADIASDEAGNISASAQVDVAAQGAPLPNLTLTAGTIAIGYSNGTTTMSVSNFGASYAGLGSIAVDTMDLGTDGKAQGAGTITSDIGFLPDVSGTVAVQQGKVSGSMRISSDNLPAGLPIESGAIEAAMSETGALSFDGQMRANFGPAGNADITASYNESGLSIGGQAQLTIPGLAPVTLTASLQSDGDLSGTVNVPIDSARLPGLNGEVEVSFAQGRWSGQTTLNFSADNGKLTGSVTVTVAQNDAGGIELGGTGQVVAQLMPGLQGTLTATILPEGGVDVSGEILVTEPYELFPKIEEDKELFKLSQNIPLWAILVAVIRVRAGVRAGIGPGVFRNIKVEGSYSFGSEEADPSFSISGELYIPAFVEGYVAFGAGLGLDVLLGSLTGGIEGVATAGIYGAISVIPTLTYADGDWSINGTATMAAGARLKLGLNAWAEVEAFWVTVWEQTWKLAEYEMAVGPNLALQAEMNYTFGQPGPPSLDFSSDNIDSDQLIRDAMPKDGPAGSGARSALQNRAEWKGQLQEQRDAPVPADQVDQANTTQTPPAPAAGSGGTPGGANAQGGPPPPANAQSPAANSAAVDDAARPDPTAAGSVPQDQVPDTGAPRYPNGINLAMLDEAPVPQARTPDQQREDLNAAKRVLELASTQASNSDTLDDYFPRVKSRFRLTQLGYEGSFDTGFKIIGKINPEFELTVHEPLSGRGLPGGDGHRTQIVHTSSNLGGSVVGMSMLAMPLGPDHPQGDGPSGQKALFDQLPTGYKDNPTADTNFIKGHLLNDWLGGEGAPRNLFPITSYANGEHSRKIEETVKGWVNDQRYWVSYEVKISDISYELDATIADNFVNSKMTAEATVLGTDLRPISGLTRKVVIVSEFGTAAVATPEVENAATLAGHNSRPEDHAIDILATRRATNAGPTMLSQDIYTTLSRVTDRTEAGRLLQTHPGFGPALNTTLWAAFDMARAAGGNLDVSSLSTTHKANLTRISSMWGSGLKSKIS